MAAKHNQSKAACSCSQKVDRRDFLKVTAVAGLLAGCSPVLETPDPIKEPTATAKPTLAPGETAVPDLAGKKAVYILPRRVYAEGCHDASVAVLKACGVSITLAAIEKKDVPGFGAEAPVLSPDKLLSEIKAADYDAVIFECGQPQETFNPDYQNLARETVAQNKVLAGICMMPALMAAAGVLKGKQAMSNINDQYVLEQFGAVLSELDPVRDGKIVTASFEGAEKFGWMIVEAIAK
jgi:protease I